MLRLSLTLAALLPAGSALAQAAPDSAPRRPEAPGKTPPEPEPEQQPKEPPRSTPRSVPDYDGRGSAYDRGGSPLLWVPRVVLFPLYVVSEYVVRRPLGWVTVQAEQANLANLLVDWFTFGPDRRAGLIPTALVDFGFRPSVGVYFFWDRALFERNEIRLHAATWGTDWLRLTLTDRVRIAPDTKIALRGAGSRRPDFLFYGLGPRAPSDAGARYSSSSLAGSLSLDHEGFRSSRFRAELGVRHVTFESAGCCDEPPILERVAEGAYELPPGFDEGYTLVHQGFVAELDTRERAPAPGHGARAVLRVEQAARTDGAEPRQWLRYSAAAGVFFDLTEQNRVIGLSAAASFADPIGSDEAIPFSEQVSLGGDAPLRGFLAGRLIDRSAVAARLEYQWPIWTFLDGSVNAEAGNVFGEHLSDFEAGLLRLSFGLGVRASGRRDHPFEFLIGTATEPIDEGAELDSFRLVFGATNAF